MEEEMKTPCHREKRSDVAIQLKFVDCRSRYSSFAMTNRGVH